MDKNLDHALKAHFSRREDIPPETKPALRAKLHNSLQRREKLRFIWLMVPCMIFTTLTIFFALEMFFGMGAAIVLGLGYYLAAIVGGTAVLIFTMVTNNRKEHAK